MYLKLIYFLCVNAILVFGYNGNRNIIFPDSFKFGAATSSYQIEGAWNVSGKSESVWDYYAHTFPEWIKDGSNGDIACDSYNQIDVDIANLKLLNVNFYRFSLNWPRILPSARISDLNPDGLRYYNELINKLIDNGIEPMITLYHWELPQSIQDLGGWSNRLVVDYFVHFARVAFEEFGDRVKTWITINEPFSICSMSYEEQFLAPFIHSEGVGTYQCGHNLLLAHAAAYHLYQDEFRARQGGEVGFTMENPWHAPLDPNNPDDIIAAERATNFHFDWFANPIYSKDGDYPPSMRTRIDNYSSLQGYAHSRLPTFTPEEVDYIRGTADFLGLNHYTSHLSTLSENQTPDDNPSYDNDLGVVLTADPAWNQTARDTFTVYPHGLRLLLNYIKETYDNPKVYITENGYAGFQNETLNDQERIWYYQGYLTSVLEAIEIDECNVQSYTAWSFMDNYEWSDGYTLRFGMFYVDFEDPKRKRTPKDSAYVYQNIINRRYL